MRLQKENLITKDGILTGFEIQNPGDVTELDLSEFGFTGIAENAFEGFTNLRKLDLSDNMITKIEPGTFDPLVNLRELDLADNSIEEIKTDMFKLPSLKILRLERNKIHKIKKDSFNRLTGLSMLDLSDNLITEIPRKLFSKTELTVVDLSYNPIKKLFYRTTFGLNPDAYVHNPKFLDDIPNPLRRHRVLHPLANPTYKNTHKTAKINRR